MLGRLLARAGHAVAADVAAGLIMLRAAAVALLLLGAQHVQQRREVDG
jgi:hypothetical protein